MLIVVKGNVKTKPIYQLETIPSVKAPDPFHEVSQSVEAGLLWNSLYGEICNYLFIAK